MARVFDRLPPRNLTYEDYVGLPDDGRRYEILDGELEVSPAPEPRHQAVSRNLLVVLYAHVQERGLGSIYYAPIDVILAPTTVMPPDLVVEILSSWSVARDRGKKAKLYAHFGIRHYWVVDPRALLIDLYEVGE